MVYGPSFRSNLVLKAIIICLARDAVAASMPIRPLGSKCQSQESSTLRNCDYGLEQVLLIEGTWNLDPLAYKVDVHNRFPLKECRRNM